MPGNFYKFVSKNNFTDKTMFSILESHTADIGIEVSGQTLEELFQEAARGWKALVLEDAKTEGKETQIIHLEAEDINDLLVQWLSELNFLLTTRQWVFHEVESIKIDTSKKPVELLATITGEPFQNSKHYIYFDIKAVTYHQLNIQQNSNGYSTRVIFDI